MDDETALSAAIPPFQNQKNIPMIRISFDTQTDSEDTVTPNAWRREAAALLREIAKRIAAGEKMPLTLMDSKGRFIGKARELSYRPEPARQCSNQGTGKARATPPER